MTYRLYEKMPRLRKDVYFTSLSRVQTTAKTKWEICLFLEMCKSRSGTGSQFVNN